HSLRQTTGPALAESKPTAGNSTAGRRKTLAAALAAARMQPNSTSILQPEHGTFGAASHMAAEPSHDRKSGRWRT
ncbi:hypothetical protein, partial [Burkholderia pseudomallei]|uniref:hypothetical protein n=1 Tax=Burkholderia pseudomallei TaxID=28450 RepID=UPI0021F7EB0B